MTYRAPVADYQFLFREMLAIETLGGSQRIPALTSTTATGFWKRPGMLAEEKIAPLQSRGDLQPA